MITIFTDKTTNDLGQDMYKKIATTRPNVRLFCMDDMNVEPCYACRGCDEKTYRRCVIRDDADLILPCLVRSQAIIVFTRIVFGSYSFSIKRIADRFALLLEKGYKCRNGELTFGKYPGIGYYVIGAHNGAETDDEEIKAFRQLVAECHKITGWVGKPIVMPNDMDEYNSLMQKVSKL